MNNEGITNEESRNKEIEACRTHHQGRNPNNKFEQPAPTFIFWRFMPYFVWFMMSSCDIRLKEIARDTLAMPCLSSKSAQLLAQRGALQTPNRTRCQRPQKHELVAPAHASPATSGKPCAHDEHYFMMTEDAGWGAPQQQQPSGKTLENNAAATFQMMKPWVVRKRVSNNEK